MSFLNIEIKAHCSDTDRAEKYLSEAGARFAGLDTQEDIYFHFPEGRLKLRRGPIENNLIFYRRNNQEGPKSSQFILHPVQDSSSLQSILCEALGVKVIVKKKQKNFFSGTYQVSH